MKLRRYDDRLFTVNSLSSELPTFISSNRNERSCIYEKIKINRHCRGGGNLSFTPHPVNQRHDALTFVRGLGGSHKDLLSLFRTFKTAYSGTLTTSAAFGKINPRPRGEREEFVNEHSEFTNSGEGVTTARSYKVAFTLAEVLSPHPTSQRRVAFTLAEVLITLGIIGVVAAMTMPALMSHYKKQEASARLKKFYSMMSQAIQMSENEHGTIKDWEYPSMNNADGTFKPNTENKGSVLTFFNHYLSSYIKYTEIDENPKDLIKDDEEDTSYIRVHLPDASYVNMKLGDCIDIDFDVNGIKPPNEHGRDIFKFLICNRTQRVIKLHCGTKYFCGMGATGDDIDHQSREVQYDACKENNMKCTKLIMMDGWEFKPDYPWKL